jgi:hypothetical protein
MSSSKPAAQRLPDEDELARMVQAKFPALFRVRLRINSQSCSLGLAGTAKDLIRCGFCNRKMIATLPKCGFKYFGHDDSPRSLRRLRSGYRVETRYRWGDDADIDRGRAEVEVALGLPAGALRRPKPNLEPDRPLPAAQTSELDKRYAGLKIKASLGAYYDGRGRQMITFTGTRMQITRAGIMPDETLIQTETQQWRRRSVYTQYGDHAVVYQLADGTYEITVHTCCNEASADDDRRLSSKKLKTRVDRLLLPFARGTWAAPATGVRS